MRLELETSFSGLSLSRTSSVADIESLKVSKRTLEAQVKTAVNLLSEETKKRAAAERQLKELQEELALMKDPGSQHNSTPIYFAAERVKKLEETIKKQRIEKDNLNQQFVMQMEKIAQLEKKLKEYRTEKLEYETKYEERVRHELDHFWLHLGLFHEEKGGGEEEWSI